MTSCGKVLIAARNGARVYLLVFVVTYVSKNLAISSILDAFTRESHSFYIFAFMALGKLARAFIRCVTDATHRCLFSLFQLFFVPCC